MDVKSPCLGNTKVAGSAETEGLLRGTEHGKLEPCSGRTGG